MAKHANHARHARKTFTSRSGKKCSRTKLPAHAYDDVILPSLMKERTRKIAASAAALAIVGALAAPMPAWAAEWIQVAGTEHTQAASGTGETGGTWSWDGADDLLLDNYSGTGILARGDLDITLEGENKVYDETSSDPATGTTEIPGGIYVYDGDLTITGEGSLDVSEDNAPAILTTYGDISIEETTVEATTTTDSFVGRNSMGAITAEGGSVDIIASTVDATLNDEGDNTGTILAIYSTSFYGSQNAGTINIIDSDVTATVSAPDRKGENLNWVNGIGAFSSIKGTAPLVNIDKSTVDVSTPGGVALRAWSRGEAEPGTINIHNSTLPEGSSIRDLYYTPGSAGSPFAGQVLATGSGTIASLDDPAILSSAHIERIADPVNPAEPTEPATSPFAPAKAYAATNDTSAADSALPTTGDAPTGIFAAIAAALTAFGATLFSWKKSKTSKK